MPDTPSQWQRLFNVPPFVIPFAANIAIDWDDGPAQIIQLTGNVTITGFANVQDGMTYTLHIRQDGVGSRLITWPAAARFRGTDAVLSIAPTAIDLFRGHARAGNIFFQALKGFV